MTAASRCPRPGAGRLVSWTIAALVSLISTGTTVARAQQLDSADLVIEPTSSPNLEKSEAPELANEPGSIRVPRASNERSLFSHGVRTSDVPARSPASAGWWLGSTGIALALAICGAACVAARKYWPQNSTGLLRVVGRVSLSPRQSIYLVRAGRRVILIGAGGQGAPTLLGELSETEQDEDEQETADLDLSSFPGPVEPPAAQAGRRSVTAADRRSGDMT
jgi:flagellar protein FliO/FliZ